MRVINSKHLELTGSGNKQLNDGDNYNRDIYGLKVTQSYINIKCNISKKCRFAMWYKYDKNNSGEPVEIKYFRTINNNHDLLYHKESNVY